MKPHILIIIIVLGLISCRKGTYTLPEDAEVITDNGSGIGTVTWTKEDSIVIQGYVFVNEGQVLTIEAGTVIRFTEGQGATASALIVARGGQIFANGTKEEPIIFTSVMDDLNGSLYDTTGLWGGVVILGDAPVNTSTGEAFVEGIPASELRALYGGSNANDNSGSLQYISIRYAGTSLHDGDELNGLSLAGVGKETTLQNIEVVNVADDGIEIFGGAPNLSNIVIVNAHDDALDYDYGYSGNIQFLLAIQKNGASQYLIEASGGTAPLNASSASKPTIANATLFGQTNATNAAILLSDFSGGIFVNNIIYNTAHGALIEYTDNQTDSYSQWERGNVIIENNIFFNVAENIEEEQFTLYSIDPNETASALWADYFSEGINEMSDLGISIEADINFMPNTATNTNLYDLTNSWFTATNYKGAFGTYDWTSGWTIYNAILSK